MDSVRRKKLYTTVKNFLLGPKNKEFLIFLLFFFVSAAFWLLQSLNEEFEVRLKVPLKLEHVPSDVVITSELPQELSVAVKDKGTVLVRYLYGTELAPVRVDYGDYDRGEPGGRVSVQLADVLKKVQAQVLSSTQIVSVKPDTLEYFFSKGARKKVPVRLSGSVSTSPEYYLQRIGFVPDSVEVLAPEAILDTITEAPTVPVYLEGLEADKKVVLGLHRARGAKFIPDRVEMNAKVDLYTEKTVAVPVIGINFPGSKDLRTFPSKVNITFRVGMSRFKDITEDDFVLAVTYEELLKVDSTKLKLHLKSMPAGVSNVRIEPPEVDYLIEQVQEENE